MNRKEIFDSIAKSLSRFKSEVEILNSNNHYDINLHAENVLIPLLNETYELKLENANKIKKNYPGIDLADIENRIAFQITVTSNISKVKHTVKEFVDQKLYEDFDYVFIYMLSSKQKSYKEDGIKELTEGKFDFDVKQHILDSTNIYEKLDTYLQLTKLRKVEEFLADEFTDEKIEERKQLAEKEELIITEDIYTNLVQIDLPEYIYMGNLNFDRDDIIKQSWATEFRLKKNASDRKVVLRALQFIQEKGIIGDWHVLDKKIISFNNLNSDDTILNKIVELGTVEHFETEDFPFISDKYYSSFKQLLNNTINQKLYLKHIKYIGKERIYRFSPTKKLIEVRKLQWKLKKRATRTVLDRKWNKDNTQVLCYKHLAFKTQIHNFNKTWYLSINPTWSFTWNGYTKSKFEPKMLKGIKQLENNQAVYNAYRFIAYCMMNKIDDEIYNNYNLVDFSLPEPMKLTFNA